MSRNATLVRAAILLLTALFVTPAAGSKPQATLELAPNPAPAFSTVSYQGCGYQPDLVVYVDVVKPSALAFTGAWPDQSGCISGVFTVDEAGAYMVSTRQRLRGGRWAVMASLQLVVVD
jgi:hypothetical protein